MRIIMAFFCVVLFGVYCNASKAIPIDKPVDEYILDCANNFSCPTSLTPRVSFWVEVFSRWDTNTAIFHDKDTPHRVYSIVKKKNACRGSSKSRTLRNEKERIKKSLELLAYKVGHNKTLTVKQKRLLASFSSPTKKNIVKAAKNIRCQSGNRDRMRKALSHFQQYRPMILQALRSQNLTEELQYLPFVESAFNPNALSHVGAAGIWQIMPKTGKSLGLQVNYKVDERYDPQRSSYAAAKYFRNSVSTLTKSAHDNNIQVTQANLIPFVITSYNYGIRGMSNAINKVGLNYENLLTQYKSPSFQTAVKNFYASFLAARHVAKNTDTFFGHIVPVTTQDFTKSQTIYLARATSAKRISSHFSIPISQLKFLNPALKKTIWQHKALIPKNFSLRLPRDKKMSSLLQTLSKLPIERERPGYTWHKVKRGQSACRIAKKYRVSCTSVKRLNGLNRRATIYAGQRIKVPTKFAGISVEKPSSTDSANRVIVKSGDTACGIAKKQKISCKRFLALNGLHKDSIIRVGQVMKVTGSAQQHSVKKGQTSCGIARKYRVSCARLLQENRLSKHSIIQVGQRLKIPQK